MNTNSRILMVLGTIIMILGITEILQAQNEVDNEDIYRWYLNIGGDPRDDYPVADGAIFTENIAIPPENNFGLADLHVSKPCSIQREIERQAISFHLPLSFARYSLTRSTVKLLFPLTLTKLE